MESRKTVLVVLSAGQHGSTDIENRLVDKGRREGGMNRESSIETCTSPCIQLNSQWKCAVWGRVQIWCSVTT